jgi:hypothetical protein
MFTRCKGSSTLALDITALQAAVTKGTPHMNQHPQSPTTSFVMMNHRVKISQVVGRRGTRYWLAINGLLVGNYRTFPRAKAVGVEIIKAAFGI